MSTARDNLVFSCVFQTVDHQLGIQFAGPKRGETVTVFGINDETNQFRVSGSMDKVPHHVRVEAEQKYAAMTKGGVFTRFPS